MLTEYLTQTAQLLQNPNAPTSLYSTANLTSWINSARGQLAGEAQCVPAIGSLALAMGTNVYPFSAITIPNAATLGIKGVLNISTIWIGLPEGQQWIRPRPWPWFSLYELNNPIYMQSASYAQPQRWSQYGQGVNGSIYVSPVPDTTYTASCDCVTVPIPLVDDTTPEAIPALFTDAVPYFAAYLALLSAQTGARSADADRMFERYLEFFNRARRFATPPVLPGIYPQQINPTRGNQLGLQPPRGGQ